MVPARPDKDPVRSILSIRFLSIRAFIPAACLLSILSLSGVPVFAQVPVPAAPVAAPPTPAPAKQTPAPAPSQPAPKTVVAPAPAPVAATPSQTGPGKEPDYPDERTMTVGMFGMWNQTTQGPHILGGAVASTSNTYENIYNIGAPYKYMPQFEFSIPVTRTGTLYAEFNRFHGWADQILPRATFVDSYSFNPGDSMHTTYHFITGRLYLDDLLYPHKFPVSKFRLKSIWGIRYISVTQTVDSASEDATAGLGGSSFQIGTNFILLPEFGAAMEYAPSRHTLFRVDAEGFGIPHHADIYEGGAEFSARKNNLEFLVGVKLLHFKTTPQKEEYEVGTFVSPFVGLRWHWQ